jgi:hypothetical protein
MARGRLVGSLVMVAALAVVASGCRRATLKGQIDLPDGEVRDIAVRVIPEKDVKPYLDGKAAAARVALDERTTAVELARREVDAAIRAHQLSPGANAAAASGAGVSTSGNTDPVSHGPAFYYDPTKYTKAGALTLARARDDEASRKRSAKAAGQFDADNQRLLDAIAGARTRYEEAQARLVAWETETLADLPKKGSVVYTNGKGNFTATVPRGDRVAVFASGKVTIDGRSQPRAWGLWVDADAVEKPLTLDTRNLLLEQPRDSVLK